MSKITLLFGLKLFYFSEIFCLDWCKENKLSPYFEDLPPPDLCRLLRKFYATVRKEDGEVYSKSSLNNIRSAIQRHLASPPFSRTINIMRDPDFNPANNMLRGTLKKSKKDGQDTTSHYRPISDGDLDKLQESGVMDPSTPEGLQNAVWFNIQFKFCRRGREGQRDLKKTDWVFKIDDRGREYVTLKYNDHQKNHPGDNNTDQEETRMYGSEVTGDKTCPLRLMKEYLAKLHHANTSFYQVPKTRYQPQGTLWYCNKPMGANKLGGMMKKMSQQAGLSYLYTNHSIRATVVQKLNNMGFEERVICSLSGHRNAASLKSYCKTSNQQKRQMSDGLQTVLRGKKPKSEAPCTAVAPPTTRPPPAVPTFVMTTPSVQAPLATLLPTSATLCTATAPPTIRPPPAIPTFVMTTPSVQAPPATLLPPSATPCTATAPPTRPPVAVPSSVPAPPSQPPTNDSAATSASAQAPVQDPPQGQAAPTMPYFMNCDMSNATLTIYLTGPK